MDKSDTPVHAETGYGGSLSSDLKNDIKELIGEIRGQKHDLNALREEVRGNSLSVSSEVKKLRTEKDICWNYEGNRIQFDFNSELEEHLKQGLWAIDNGKIEYAVDLFKESCDKLRVRNKHIRIADSTEGGWETVKQYVCNPLARNSEDESRISRADSRALKKKKVKQRSKSFNRPSAAYGISGAGNRAWGGPSVFTGTFPTQNHGQTNEPRYGSFRGSSAAPSFRRNPFTPGPCTACGELNHIRRTCPYTRTAQQPELPGRK